LAVAICASNEGVAMLFGMSASGAGAIFTPCRQHGQAFFGAEWGWEFKLVGG
jgi:hypothetical protein